MNFTAIGVVLLFLLPAFQTENSVNNSIDEVRLPQIGSLQKLANVGRAYKIPEGMTLVEYYEQEKNTTADGEEEVTEIKSDKYPTPYPSPTTKEYKISVENSKGIEIIIHDLDIDPHNDFIKLGPVEDGKTLDDGMIFTGTLLEPLKVRLLRGEEMKLQFKAETNRDHKHRGFRLTYYPYRNVTTTRKPAPERILSFDKLPSINVLLTVLAANQTKETWEYFRGFLCNATNQFLKDNDLPLETCQTQNVTIKTILKCADQWPNSEQCIDLSFAINLYAHDDEASYNPVFRESREPVSLSKDQLNEIWRRFGKSIFFSSGFPEYQLPDASSTITLWIGIVLGIVGLAFVILVVMMRLNAIKDYWPTLDDDKQNILKNPPELDICMYPSPDQMVPPMFPVGVIPYGGENGGDLKIQNESNQQENEALRRQSSTGTYGEFNQGFVHDEGHAKNVQTTNPT